MPTSSTPESRRELGLRRRRAQPDEGEEHPGENVEGAANGTEVRAGWVRSLDDAATARLPAASSAITAATLRGRRSQ